MKTKRIILSLMLLVMTITYNIALGQISQGGVPYSFEADYKRKSGAEITLSDTVPVIKMPQISQSAIYSIKEKNKRQEIFQFAYGFETNIDVKQKAVVDSLDVGLLYRLSIKSSYAYSLNIIFKKYKLPRGAKLFIYSMDKQDLKGAYTSNNNKESEILSTIPVKGDEIIIEYFEPYYSDFNGKLTIGKVSHDFVDILNTEDCDDCDDFGSSGNCQVDINCQEGDDWQDEKRSVLRILLNGDTWCSGVLLNNTNEDGTPYVLTANHCTCAETDIDKYCFIFNYESPSCNGPDGSIAQSICGGTLRATRAESDFTLIELSLTPLSTYTPFYAGWDRNDAQGAGGVGIHHPSGDVKKISTFTMIPDDSECFDFNYSPTGCNSTFYPNDNFYQINWVATANGHSVTEGASSGSPLFNNDGRVIGQLFGAGSCDNPNCNDPANDNGNYGKIFSSWDDGNDASERLRDWLNPQNDVFALDGISGCGQGMAVNLNITHTITNGSVELNQATNTITANNTVESGATATYEAETVNLTDGFTAEPGSDFIARSSVWNTAGIATGIYNATVSFSTDCQEISNTYQLMVASCKKSANNTSDTFNSNIDKKEITNIAETEKSDFDLKVFPNPNEGSFKIEFYRSLSTPYSFQIINASGSIIYNIEHLNAKTINVEQKGLSNGIYYVRIQQGANETIKKVIIKR